MTQDQPDAGATASVLRRKTQSGKAEHQAKAMSLPKALRLTLAKLANDLLGMAMVVIGARQEQRRLDTLQEVLDDAGLLMLLDGPGGARGAAVLDAQLVGGLIQQQTMGRVLPGTDPVPRRMTATDAAICAPFIDKLLARAAALPEAEQDRQLLEGYRFGARAESARHLLMGLHAPDFEVVHLTIDIASGQRQGQLLFCLPPVSAPSPMPEGRQDGPEEPTTPDSRLMAETTMSLNVELRIGLARLKMPLSAVSTLQPGQVLELEQATFNDVRVLTTCGRKLASGTLGQLDGMRAVRLVQQGFKRPQTQTMTEDKPPSSTATRQAQTSRTNENAALQRISAKEAMPDLSDLPGFEEADQTEIETREAG